jgi:hypothetical protein
MAQIVTLTVPPEEAELVLEALLSVYAARATSVGDQIAQHDHARLREVRAELVETGRMLDLFGWERGRRAGTAELAGPEPTVGEVLRLALADAHEALGDRIEAYHRGSATIEELLSSLERLRAMTGRFAAFEREHAL